MTGGILSRQVLRCGYALALACAFVQAVLHLVDVYAFDGRVAAINSDNAGEGNVFTWASSSATFAAAIFCLLLAVAGRQRRVVLSLVAAVLAAFSLDDALVLHERATPALLDFVGLDPELSRAAWPALLLPLMAFVAIAIWQRAALAIPDERRALRAGIALLGLAVALELALFPVPDGSRAREVVEPLFVAAEESIELGAWILLAAGLAGVLVRQIAINSQREAVDRRGRDDHPDGPALVAGERGLRGLRRG